MKMSPNNVDLHTHTTASDGVLEPQALLDLAIENGTHTLAITDHDTIEGYLAAHKTAQQRGVHLISGVEISTTWGGMGIHIVGLNFDAKHPAIGQLLNEQAQARQQRAESILHKLAKVNCPMTLKELQDHANTQHIGRPHIAQLMLAKGYVSSIDKAFKKYLGAGKIGDVKNGWATLPTTISAVRESGGMAVIAHPNHYKMTRSKLLRMVAEFSEMGGQGIEVISGKQQRDITLKIAHIANEYNLYASLGSDFHRPFRHAANVGVLDTLPECVTPIWQAFETPRWQQRGVKESG